MKKSLEQRAARRLLPYTGPRIRVRDNVGSPWSTGAFDHDQSGERLYAFNALGFRGPEFRPDAAFIAFVFGESDAFGAGIEFEESWGYLAAHAEASRRGFSSDDVCVMNFAESGASNAYIARTVLTQCSAVRPDVVLVGLASDDRTEAISGEHSFAVGPWLHSDESVKAANEAPDRDGLRERLLRCIERGLGFIEFNGDPDQRVYQTLQSLLLIQGALVQSSLPGVIIARQMHRLGSADARNHPLLGPLIALLNRHLVAPTPTETVAGKSLGPDGFHWNVDGHRKVAEYAAAFLRDPGAHDPLTRLDQVQPDPKVAERVFAFYEDLPFNYHGTEASAAHAASVPSIASTYLDLAEFLKSRPKTRVLEVGCGAGWLSHGLALQHDAVVHSIDLSAKALKRARALGKRLATDSSVRFEQRNVFEFRSEARYDLALSMGVLHHTADPRTALARMVEHLVPHGHVYLGLYHEPGRKVFLEEMHRIVRSEGEEAAFKRYRELDSAHARDETLARSWFRDQVLHPHETQHTLKEVVGWFEELGLELTSTSINRFFPIESLDELFVREQEFEFVSRRALFDENRYFPGFFTAFARRLS